MANKEEKLALRYFEDVLAVEFATIDERRTRRGASPIRRNLPRNEEAVARVIQACAGGRTTQSRNLSPDPDQLFKRVSSLRTRLASKTALRASPSNVAFAEKPPTEQAESDCAREEASAHTDVAAALPKIKLDAIEAHKQRPTPVPCDAVGLALSGGGIRSAAVCLGALQALHSTGRLDAFDYLSTVSGGGYIGATLSAAAANMGAEWFPFGGGKADDPAVSHLRDYSNYLLPRGRSPLRNFGEAASILLRGLLSNCVLVSAALFLLAVLTRLAYPTFDSLGKGSFLPSLVENILFGLAPINRWIGARPFALTLLLMAAFLIVALLWAIGRSSTRRGLSWSDASSKALRIASLVLVATVVCAFFDVQPVAIGGLATSLADRQTGGPALAGPIGVSANIFGAVIGLKWLGLPLGAFATAMSYFGRILGLFLKTTETANDYTTIAKRAAAQIGLFIAAMILPTALWIVYLYLSAAMIEGWGAPSSGVAARFPATLGMVTSIVALLLLLLVAGCLKANAYSLHRFYRDRLSQAFLFWCPPGGTSTSNLADDLKLSELQGCAGPYHIVNAALNIQGSKEANRRGREADFFMFTPHFVGSDLTFYAPTNSFAGDARGMEDEDPALNLATAMAISGAAVSANMGANTVRLLSPTLALLNILLGYWLRNPRHLAKSRGGMDWLRNTGSWFMSKFYLLAEMLNLLDEESSLVYLTDGGHIDNLGLYELLKRGCKLIVVIDAEADPMMTFQSLLQVQRYARIDFGVRIELPWGGIAERATAVDKAIVEEGVTAAHAGPHCTVGRILYSDEAEGLLLYFKSSLTGDEKDYVLDYKKRNLSFPHETTGDQFFSEEQFEVYRALGFHMVEHFFNKEDEFGFMTDGVSGFSNHQAAFDAIDKSLPRAFAKAVVKMAADGGSQIEEVA